MPEPQTSLLSQGELFSAKEVEAYEAELCAEAEEGEYGGLKHPERKVFTAARLHGANPRLYAVIVKLIAEQRGLIRIAQTCAVSVHTVVAIRERESGRVAIEQGRLATHAKLVAELALEGLEEDLSDPVRRAKVAPKDKAVIAGIAVQNAQLLTGEPTVRLERTVADPEHDDYLTFIEGNNSTFIEAELVEGSDTGSTGESAAQKGEPDARDALQIMPASSEPAPAAGPTDSESVEEA